MSLVTRLSAFFLTALALVLIGFSLSLYLLARAYLFGQAEQRLTAALDTLAAAVESEPAGLEWEGNERRLSLGHDAGAEQPRWEVRTESGQLVDRSANLAGAELDRDAPWRFAQRLVRHAEGASSPAEGPGRQRRYPALVLSAAVSLAPAQATLRALAAALALLSLSLWLTAALLGRRLCRRALAPVTRMAEAARDMGAADLSQRLPGPATPDELGALHGAFNGLLDRLQEAFARQQRFTGDASHQLRTPLTAMLGQLDLALRRDRPADEYRRVLGAVHGQAERLRQIVEALLFLARADAEADLGELETVELVAWLREHLQGWAAHPRALDLRQTASADGPLPVRAQPLLLGQLLDNLLDNACKYSAPGTPVAVTLGREGDAATLTVEDAGSGIAADELPHVFTPFYRSADARRRGLAGTGLGLAVARRIATALGASLVAASAWGQGSRFTLRLPVGEPGASATGG